MKATLPALLLVIAAAAAAFISHSQAIFTEVNPGSCCTEHHTRPVPLRLLASYEHTSSKCALPAVIFVTKRSRQFCADPQVQWTQERIRRLTANRRPPPPAAAS